MHFVTCDGDGSSIDRDGYEHVVQLKFPPLLAHFIQLIDLEVGIRRIDPIIIVLHVVSIIYNIKSSVG